MEPRPPEQADLPTSAVAATVEPTRVCVIDIGTNSFHTIIVDVFPNGSFVVVDRLKDMVKLGEGGFGSHRLTDDAVARGMTALRRIKSLADGYGAHTFVANATSAIREATNGRAFIEQVKADFNIAIRPISGRTEAVLIYKGVRRAVPMPKPTLIVDIGGGSTEFIIGTNEEMLFAESYKIGANRMLETFITTDPVEKSEFKALRAHYRKTLERVFEALETHDVHTMVGSSGSMQNLAQIALKITDLDEPSIFGHTFDAKPFRKVTKQVMRASRSEREEMPGLDVKRIDQIVAAAILVDVLIKDNEIRHFRVSPAALREGMVMHFAEQNAAREMHLAQIPDVRRRSVFEMGSRFAWDEGHAQQVAQLALRLFDELQPVHELGVTEREWLEYAALLHDIGYHISHSAHHKHSMYLIEHGDLRGFKAEEEQIIAQVARYHRKAFPKKKHESFQQLSKAHKEVVVKLAALLRLAEGLDRGHNKNLRSIALSIQPDVVWMAIDTKDEADLELMGAQHADAFFEYAYDRRLVVSQTAPIVAEAGGDQG